MSEFFHDTAFGDLVHFVSRGRCFRSHTEKADISDFKHYFTTDENTGEILVGWYGDDDPENPYNWSFAYKLYVTWLMFLMTMTVYMGSSIVSPVIPQMAEYFHVSEVVTALSLSLFVCGYGVGPCLLSPITEISWVGRNGPYIFGLGLFSVLQIPNALVDNIAGYMILRFISGFLGGPVLTTGGASIGDMWRIEGGFMNALAFWDLGACGGPTLGPIVSSYAVQELGWRWSIWPLLCMNGITWLVLFFTLPETSGETILTRRARQIRKKTGSDKYRSRGELKDRRFRVSDLVVETLYRPFELTFTEPVLLCTNIYLAYIYGIMYCFFEAFPLTFQGKHGFSLGALGIAYVGGYIGCVIVFLGYCVYNQKVVLPRFKAGKWRPEYRMEPGFVGGLLFPTSVFWFGWTTFTSVHWISPLLAYAVFMGSTYLIFQAFYAYLGENFPRYLASAYTSNGLFRSGFGGAFPLFSTAMFNRLTLQGGCSLLGGLAALMIPITVAFYIYGDKLRAMSKRTGEEPPEVKAVIDPNDPTTKEELDGPCTDWGQSHVEDEEKGRQA